MAALGRNRAIGLKGTLPWKLPGDLAHFRRLTRGGVVLMGRSTYDSIGQPLPHRKNWVLTRNPEWSAPSVRVLHEIGEVLHAASEFENVWVIGGEQIYRELLPFCDRQVLTFVDAAPEGDSFYPEFPASEWQIADRQPGPAGEQHAYEVVTYQRVAPT